MTSTRSNVTNHPFWGWTGLFALSAFEALAALVYLVSLPADPENALILGFSLRRLIVAVVLLGGGLAGAGLAFASARPAWRARWLDPSSRRGLFNAALVLLPLGTVVSGLIPVVLMSLYRTSGEFHYAAYFERLLPMLLWLGLVCLQGTVWLAWIGDFQWGALRVERPVLRAAVAVFCIFLTLWLLVALTGIGITPDRIGWGKPSVPLLEWHIWLAAAVGMAFLLFLAGRRWSARKDLWVSAAIWLLAAGLWLSQPIYTAYFATAGREPNFEIYPFSDGTYYGLFAQNLLIGNGFKGDEVPPRPLYITLLAVFHAVAGQSYEDVIRIQTLLLAFLPVILYWIGKELHSRPAGLVAALFAILREMTAMAAAPITDKASTSQLFFADLPSALAISFSALLALYWLKGPQRRPLMPFWVGGGLGLAMLFRTQSLFILPGVLLLALLALRGRWKTWLAQTGLLLLGLGLVIAPWLWRNWQITGQITFDDPKTQTGVMAQRYHLDDPDARTEYLIRPDEDLDDFSERVNQGIFSYLLDNPADVARFVSAHWANAQIDNLLLLPVRDGIRAPGDLLSPTEAFWQTWDASPTLSQSLLLAFNLALLALGIGAAYARMRWAGLALLLMNLSYNASNALARNSGWRYLLPVDWMTYTYAALGLMELALGILLVLGIPMTRLKIVLSAGGEESETRQRVTRQTWVSGVFLGLAFVLVGSFPLAVERAFPRRYPLQTEAELVQEVLDHPALRQAGVDLEALEQFARQSGVQMVKGRALYPRYYGAGDGEPRTAKAGYEPLDDPRSLFQMASNTFNGLVMLRAEAIPQSLPNAADVIVVGCPVEEHIDATLVLVLSQPDGVYLADRGFAACPTVYE